MKHFAVIFRKRPQEIGGKDCPQENFTHGIFFAVIGIFELIIFDCRTHEIFGGTVAFSGQIDIFQTVEVEVETDCFVTFGNVDSLRQFRTDFAGTVEVDDCGETSRFFSGRKW